jgi:hypothetical protein
VHARSDRATQAAPEVTAVRRGRRADPPVIALQRAVGNAAVARMVEHRTLARTPKPSASSKSGPPKHKKSSLTSAEEGWDFATLIGHGGDAAKDGDLAHAIALYEQAYTLNPRRDIAFQLYRWSKELGDTDQATHWLGVSNGQPHEAAPPVSYQSI